MVSINGGARKNVCRQYPTYLTKLFPDEDTATAICKKLGFHRLRGIGDLYGDSYPFKFYYSVGLHGLKDCNPKCTYVSSSLCTNYYYTYLSCGCDGNFYASAAGCMPCPLHSTVSYSVEDRCSCKAGMYWSRGNCITSSQK